MRPNIIINTTSKHLGHVFSKDDFNVFYTTKNKDDKYYFPDGEMYIRLDKVDDIKGRTIIIHSGAPDPNKGLIELEIILSILKKNKVKPIEVFFTYFPYGMQDKSFLSGELNIAEDLLKKLVNYYKVSKIYIIEPHFSHRDWIKSYPIKIISTLELFSKMIKDKYSKLFFLSADCGQIKRSGIDGVKKKRMNSHNVKFVFDEKIKTAVKKRNICIIDDLIETGNTLNKLFIECKKNGAKQVVVFVSHAVLLEGVKKVSLNVDEFYTTNTIRRRRFNVDIGSLIIDNINSVK